MPRRKNNSLSDRLISPLVNYLQTGMADLAKAWDALKDDRQRRQLQQKVSAFFRLLYSRITTEGVLKESASLTYITILGFVPFLMFIVMIAPELPFLNLKTKVSNLVTQNFLPNSATAINGVFQDMLGRRAGFNIFSFVLMLITSYSLFKVIRDTFDRILSMQFRYRQDWLSQIVKFLGTIIFGLFIMVLLFSSSSLPLISKVLKLPFLQWLMFVVPFFMQFLGLIFLYMLMPSIRIKRSSLFRGAFWTTVVWVLAKSLFDFYIYNLTNIQAVYGVLAALPIFLMWIYINWVIILGGIVLVSVIDSKGMPAEIKKEPRQMVRLTMEMFSDGKLNQRLERYMSRKEMKDFTESLDDEGER
jgi:membrane protein